LTQHAVDRLRDEWLVVVSGDEDGYASHNPATG
jgi:hypothetical protein